MGILRLHPVLPPAPRILHCEQVGVRLPAAGDRSPGLEDCARLGGVRGSDAAVQRRRGDGGARADARAPDPQHGRGYPVRGEKSKTRKMAATLAMLISVNLLGCVSTRHRAVADLVYPVRFNFQGFIDTAALAVSCYFARVRVCEHGTSGPPQKSGSGRFYRVGTGREPSSLLSLLQLLRTVGPS